jgi:hypothetical protein
MTLNFDRDSALAFSTSLIFGTVLSAADKMGIKPMLLGRQASKIMAPIINELSKKLQDKKAPSNLKELVEDLEIINKSLSSIMNYEIETSFSNNCYTEKLTNCAYIEMAKFGKSMGYNACPLCGITIILMGGISALGIAEILDTKVENNENACTLKIFLEPK